MRSDGGDERTTGFDERRLRPLTATDHTRVRALSEVNCAFASAYFWYHRKGSVNNILLF
jgi:hypothetical protein